MNNKDMPAKYKVGNMPTLNQDCYPGLGMWWVQIWDLQADTVLCRAYGESPEMAHKNATDISAALAELERRG